MRPAGSTFAISARLSPAAGPDPAAAHLADEGAQRLCQRALATHIQADLVELFVLRGRVGVGGCGGGGGWWWVGGVGVGWGMGAAAAREKNTLALLGQAPGGVVDLLSLASTLLGHQTQGAAATRDRAAWGALSQGEPWCREAVLCCVQGAHDARSSPAQQHAQQQWYPPARCGTAAPPPR